MYALLRELNDVMYLLDEGLSLAEVEQKKADLEDLGFDNCIIIAQELLTHVRRTVNLMNNFLNYQYVPKSILDLFLALNPESITGERFDQLPNRKEIDLR
jgi:hypothetical protein